MHKSWFYFCSTQTFIWYNLQLAVREIFPICIQFDLFLSLFDCFNLYFICQRTFLAPSARVYWALNSFHYHWWLDKEKKSLCLYAWSRYFESEEAISCLVAFWHTGKYTTTTKWCSCRQVYSWTIKHEAF